MSSNSSIIETITKKIKSYSLEQIQFTKSSLLGWLALRNKSTIKQLSVDLFDHSNLVHVEKQERSHQSKAEIRYSLYFVYSNRKGRCYIITFTKTKLKIITVFPIGRKTLNKYQRKFK